MSDSENAVKEPETPAYMLARLQSEAAAKQSEAVQPRPVRFATIFWAVLLALWAFGLSAALVYSMIPHQTY